jgi:uncharacterized integral membrane protein
MKFCPVVPEICVDKFMVHKKQERKRRIIIIIIIIHVIIIIIIIRNGAKTVSLQMLFGRLN